MDDTSHSYVDPVILTATVPEVERDALDQRIVVSRLSPSGSFPFQEMNNSETIMEFPSGASIARVGALLAGFAAPFVCVEISLKLILEFVSTPPF